MNQNESLRIAILSRNPDLYSTRRLQEAALQRGHQVDILDTLRFGIYVKSHEPELTYGGKEISRYDAVIPRIGASVSFYGTAVVRQFEQTGVFCLNSSASISAARDKLRSMQVLSRHDVGIAQTAFVRAKRDVLRSIEKVGGEPVIIKLLEGTQGVGVILAETKKVAEAIIETLQSTRQNVLVQKFVKESKGKDVRAFVIGDRVVAAMRRMAHGTEFRSNVHRGGSTETVHLSAEYERTAVRAAQILGLRVAGVDLLEGNDGPIIMEVNASPGLEGIEGITKLDIAGEIIDYIADHVRFEDLDIRQRLSFAKGYVVAEFSVTDESRLAGKALAQSGLKDRGIIVMSIQRMDQHIPAPQGRQTLHAGDTLLCYGPKIALREYVPTLEIQRKRKKTKALP